MLGSGEWRAFIGNKGGGVIYGELPFTSLNASRILDDTSVASITLSLSTSNPFHVDCDLVNLIRPWEHELVLYRDAELAWVGPVIEPLTFSRDEIQVGGRDLFAWYERNNFPYAKDHLNKDLGDVFAEYATDLIAADPGPSMNLQVQSHKAWAFGDREVRQDYRLMADDMRELARSGVDFTVVGRRLIVGGDFIGVPSLGTLTDDSFIDPSIEARGNSYANVVVVIGGTDDPDFPPVGVKKNHREILKLGQVVTTYTESTIREQVGLDAAAKRRVDFLSAQPFYPSGAFSPDAPVEFEDLLPGARVDLRWQVGCKELIGEYQLKQLEVNVGEDGETVTPTFVPSIGATGAGED